MPFDLTVLDPSATADLLAHTAEPAREALMMEVIATYVRSHPDLADAEMVDSVTSFVAEIYRKAGLAA